MGNHLLPIMDEDKDSRPEFRGEVEMPVLLGSDDPAHNVTILDQAGKAIEWNGEDYVEAGTEVEQAQQSRDGKDEERDSDQYLESDDSTLRKSGNRDSADDFTSDTEAPLELKRTVGLFSGISLIVGTMIGSGIFVSPTGLLDRTGSVAMSLIVWVACGFVSMLGALAYAELGTMIPSSGAEYAYFMEAFGPFPAYMFSWVSTMIIKPSQLAIICMSFAAYSVEAFAYVNCWSVELATKVQDVFCSCKLVAVAIIIAGGCYKMALGNYEHVATGFKGTTNSIGNIATAFYSG